jgi:hypothetical protein
MTYKAKKIHVFICDQRGCANRGEITHAGNEEAAFDALREKDSTYERTWHVNDDGDHICPEHGGY